MATMLNRRSFFRSGSALLAAAQANFTLRTAAAATAVPVGLSLYAVEAEFTKDPRSALQAVAQMGYKVVEFWAPYMNWTAAQARDTRRLMDDLGIHCYSTHNYGASFTAEGLPKAIELNRIIGSRDIVMSGNHLEGPGAVDGKVTTLDGWKKMSDFLASISARLKSEGLRAGYHNHPVEFTPIDGKRPIDVITANTPKDVVLQLCVGACVGAHADPVAFIKSNPGRIRHIHCKDYSPQPDKGYAVLLGEGVSPWPQLFAAAESVGGVEFYLLENLGSSDFRSLANARRSIANWKRMRG